MITAISIIVAFICGFFCAVKAIYIGLKWKIQIENKQEPKLESPIAQIFEKVQEIKFKQEEAEILDEYVNGPKPKKR